MTARTFFKLLDIATSPLQNRSYRRFVRKNGIRVEHDIIYDEGQPEIRRGDLYISSKVPEGQSMPILLNIHGGGFVAGDKKMRRYYSAYMADGGMAVFNINYGVGPANKFPYGIHSIVKAISWIADNAEKYNFDLEKFAIGGDSAGAMISLVTGVMSVNPEFAAHWEVDYEDIKIKPKRALLACGPYDVSLLKGKSPFNLFKKIFHESMGVTSMEERFSYKYYEGIHPLRYMTSDFPKSLLIYAEKDVFCTVHHDNLMESLDKHNVEYIKLSSNTTIHNHCFHLFHNFKLAREALKLGRDFVMEM